ncbi:MAG: type II toxin-antitoxin system RelE/ParE family toxin [Legionellales bacterium]|nr:type II toxin-antitoxin system RelE/ParE family toxin [Legionellales bacterium]
MEWQNKAKMVYYRSLTLLSRLAGQKIIVTNAFHKKTDKLPPKEKERALKIKENYESRISSGDYYE